TFDGEFADRVQRAFGIDVSRSVSYLAAPAFAAAMLAREVIGTISVRRHVLLIADLPVGAGSTLDGQRVDVVSRAGEIHLLGGRPGRGQRTTWSPGGQRRLTSTDRLIVVATRAGLSDLVRRSAAGNDPEPEPGLLVPDRPLPPLR